MAKSKRPKVSSLGGISKEEAQNIGKRVTVPTPEPVKPVKPVKKPVVEPTAAVSKPVVKPKSRPISKPIAAATDPMVIVRIRKAYKLQAKAKASTLDLNLYEYLEQLIEKDLKE